MYIALIETKKNPLNKNNNVHRKAETIQRLKYRNESLKDGIEKTKVITKQQVKFSDKTFIRFCLARSRQSRCFNCLTLETPDDFFRLFFFFIARIPNFSTFFLLYSSNSK